MFLAAITVPTSLPTIGLASFLHVVFSCGVAFHCLRKPREPRSLLVWLFIVFSFPFLGAALYLMFGINRAPSKAWAKAASDKQLAIPGEAAAPVPPRIYWNTIQPGRLASSSLPASLQSLDATLDRLYADFPLLGGNAVIPYFDAADAIEAMLAAIAEARHHIHLQTYIIGADATGRRVMDLLKQKASEGVNVRFMYDAFGSTPARWRRFFAPYAGIPNLHIYGFTQVNLLKRQFQINLRNHRKILVIDGTTAFTGGTNLHDVYAPSRGPAAIKDVHFRLHGPAVLQLQYTFLCDWFYMSHEESHALLTRENFPLSTALHGGCALRVLNGSAGEFPRRYEDAVFAAVSSAWQRVWIATPYFIPTDEMLRVLRNAALRGVDVRILLPGRNNHGYVKAASRASYDELLRTGVRIFERRPPFSHVKLLLADDQTVLFGSANVDTRSLRLNYETNCLVFDPTLATETAAFLSTEFAQSDEFNLDTWLRRPLYRQMLENFCTLFNPVL